MREDYWALALTLAAAEHAAAEAVANWLWEAGALGVVEECRPAACRPTRTIRAFFPPGTDPHAVSGCLTAYLEELRGLNVSPAETGVEVHRLPAEAWADAWRAHFRPVAAGRRLLVCPPWEMPAGTAEAGRAGSRTAVVIEPGRAFGTGGHASTLGCLDLLERALDAQAVRRALDIGTGSGVLAIAAARLGVPDVRAFDLDGDAVAAACANVARNGVGDRVRVEIASLETWRGAPAELVLANLLGATHVAHAGLLARCLGTRGRLIAGGLVVHETPAVAGAFVPEGLRLMEMVEREGWATLLLARDD